MSKPSPVKNPTTPAAPSAADAASAAGNQSSQVGAGKQPGAGDSSAPGSASNPSESRPGDMQTGEQKPGDVETGKQARPSGEPPAGTGRKAARKPKLHPRALDADIPAAVLTAACGDTDFTDVLEARRYPDRWVLVLMSAKDVRKVKVPL